MMVHFQSTYLRAFLITVFIAMRINSLRVNCLTVGQVSFTISKWDTCGDSVHVLLSMSDVTVGDCILECAIRSHCKALQYKARMKFCQLLSEDGETTAHAGCEFVKKSDITTKNIPCDDCTAGQVCDLSSKSCINRECTLPVVANGTLMGNAVTAGRVFRIRCDIGFKAKNGTSSAECLEDGSWNQTLSCIPAPGSENQQATGQEDEEEMQESTEESNTACHSIDDQATDAWCTSNCYHVPPHCPSYLCVCD